MQWPHYTAIKFHQNVQITIIELRLSTIKADAMDREIERMKAVTAPCKCEKAKNCPYGSDYGGYQGGVAVISKMRTLP